MAEQATKTIIVGSGVGEPEDLSNPPRGPLQEALDPRSYERYEVRPAQAGLARAHAASASVAPSR